MFLENLKRSVVFYIEGFETFYSLRFVSANPCWNRVVRNLIFINLLGVYWSSPYNEFVSFSIDELPPNPVRTNKCGL